MKEKKQLKFIWKHLKTICRYLKLTLKFLKEREGFTSNIRKEWTSSEFWVFQLRFTLHPNSMTFKDPFSLDFPGLEFFFLKFYDFPCLYAPWKYSLQRNPKKYLRKSNISEKYLSIAEILKISHLRYFI